MGAVIVRLWSSGSQMGEIRQFVGLQSGLQGADFDLFKDMLGGLPWVGALTSKRDPESWLSFKHHFFQTRDECISKTKQSGKGGMGPAEVSKELTERH